MSGGDLLLVEDDPSLSELLEYRFTKEGFSVRSTANGDDALLMAREQLPDLVILDWMIEGTSGIEVCRRLRRQSETAKVPIIMLTAREAEDDRLRGFDTGADDYLTKPFSPRELIARVTAVLRRARPAVVGEILEVGELKLDPDAYQAWRAGVPLKLGPTEFRLLRFLMESSGRVLSRNQLLDGVWGTGSDIELRTVDVHIRRLRKALEIEGQSEDQASPVRTVRSAGYMLEK